MSVNSTDLVRSSRDGDQFHYYWAARQCLKLLLPGSGLAAVSIEGSSPEDPAAVGERAADGDDADPTGEYVVDIAEYYGDAAPDRASQIVYRQLKHSTEHADQPWTVSGLKKTLKGFGRRFSTLGEVGPGIRDRVSFEFVSNRPVDDTVLRALGDISQGTSPASPKIAEYIRTHLGLSDDLAQQFCQQFRVDNRAPGLLRLAHLFKQDVGALLPGAPNDGPLRLKEDIARRATSLETDLVVTAGAVLAALGASRDQLLPAPSLLQEPEAVVPVPQAAEIARTLTASQNPVVVHAAGGVGKSVLASQLAGFLSGDSVCLVYDCFALGGYRRSSSPRHEHRQGYVQLANELAGAGLCDPLVPGGTPSASDFSRAFMARIRTAGESLAAQAPDALLVLAIDAADNAVIAADERDTGRSFVVDLLREEMPPNVRVVEFCRTERIGLLEPPPGTVKLQLSGFTLEQSRQHLESRFGPVQPGDAREFHRRTGGNARVQDQVMRESATAGECLARLGEVSGTDVATVDDLLARLVDDVIYHNDAEHAAGVRAMCEALALLRPRIPVEVLASLCGVPTSLVHSFAADLGGSLLADADSLQFLNEPTETWFRARFRPEGEALRLFVGQLAPLARRSGYVAASLPQLMWECGDFDELVRLALTGEALPEGNDIERQQVAQQRLQFALKAALRRRAYLSAARLALRAGAQGSGHSRLLRLLRENSDLAGTFLDPQTIEDLVATRDLAGDWPNSNLLREGALLSFAPSQQDYARSRLRSAIEWTAAWVNAPRGEHEPNGVSAEDIAEIAIGLLNVDGAAAAVEFLQRWRPLRHAVKPAAIIAARLAQQGRDGDISNLLQIEDASEHVLLGVASSAAQAGLILDSQALERCVAMLRARGGPDDQPAAPRAGHEDPDILHAICWIMALGTRHGLLTRPEAVSILARYLPARLPAGAGSWWNANSGSMIKGLALLECLRGEAFDVDTLAPKEVAEARQRPGAGSHEVAEFTANVKPFAAWAELWARVMLGDVTDADADFKRVAGETLQGVSDYQTPRMFINAAARTASLLLAIESSESSRAQFAQWVRSNHRFITRWALTEIVQHAAASPELHDLALEVAGIIAGQITAGHDSADERIGDLIGLSRAIWRLSQDESREYFQQAVEAAELVGDDVRARWDALLKISGTVSREGSPDRARAYRLAQVAEGLAPYLDDALDHGAAIHAIGQLDPCEGIAVASRWRDRRMGWLDNIVEALAVRDDCTLDSEPLACIAMTLLQQRPDVLRTAGLAVRRRPADAQVIADAVAALPRSVVSARSALEMLRAAAAGSGVAFDGSCLERQEAPQHLGYEETGSRDWGRLDDAGASAREAALIRLDELDLSTGDGIAAARTLCRDRGTRLTWEHVSEAALSYPPAALAQVIHALTADTGLSEFAYRDAVNRLAARTDLPLSARSAAREMVRMLAKRFCVSLTTRSYDLIEPDALEKVAGRDVDPLGIALEELGRRPETLSGEECFALAGRLSGRLSPAVAAQAFDDAADQFQDIAPADAADGPVGDVPAPPATAASCVAGFIWAALGDAAIATRWRAAHAVCVLVSLRETAVLGELARYASGQLAVGPFADHRLHFYDRHALVWLLLALERSAASPDCHGLVPFIPFLLDTAAADRDHVLVRQSTSRTLLALHATGLAALEPPAFKALEAVNTPVGLPPERSPVAASRARSDAHLRFFFDFDKHWCYGLAEAFGLSVPDVTQMASDVADAEWDFARSARTEEDERRNRGLCLDDSTWGYGSEWPKEDDLGRYLGFHALMTVGGRLIRQQPVYGGEPGAENSFGRWLQGFRPSRGDGRWLADRRDAAPAPAIPLPPAARGPGRGEWELSLTADSFETCLLADADWVTVWDDSTERYYDQSQDTRLCSALVDAAHSRALAAALQTAGSYDDFRLPDTADGDFTVDESGYWLSGWITTCYPHEGIDTYDPLAARIAFPPPRPSQEVATLLGISSDEDMREWRSGDTVVMRSTLWDDSDDRGEHSPGGPRGTRLEIRRDALCKLLRLTGRHLILTVMIDRSYLRRRHSRDGDDSERFPYLEKSYKVFTIGADGIGISLLFGQRPGQGSGGGTRPV
jgi:hypothetical protein